MFPNIETLAEKKMNDQDLRKVKWSLANKIDY